MKRKAIIISLSGFRLKQNEKKLIKTQNPLRLFYLNEMAIKPKNS